MGTGLLLCLALPPWGFWPLTFAGLLALDRLVAGQPPTERFGRGFTVGLGWFLPSIAWMHAMTLPGYVAASCFFSLLLAVAVVAAPADRRRHLALPGALVLVELLRWHWPFGGVPLSNLAVAQVSGPLAPILRVGGSLLLVWATAAAGTALAAASRRDRLALVPAALVAALLVLGLAAPRGTATGSVDVALVQGGGPQGTRADETDPREVVERHLAATDLVEPPVDLVLWPEDVVDVDRLSGSREEGELRALADRLDATLVVGIVEDVDEDEFLNAAVVYGPDGDDVDRYEKVERVPFGEWVPARSLLEPFAGDALPSRDARTGTGPAVIDTAVGRFGVAISWEIFFGARAREAVGNGGEVLLNPTNGSSFEGTLVQTQQVASSRIRAVETGRWVVQAAPTGFTAVISPDGDVLERSGVGEQRVIHATVERREGLTIANRVGNWPALALAVAGLAVAWWPDARERLRSRPGGSPGRG